MTALEELKFNLREEQSAYFSDAELQHLLDKNKISDDGNGNVVYDLEKASYEGLIMKAEDDSIKLSGLDIPNSQKYFLRLAKHYRPNSTGIMKRADEK